jgi:malate dehydrogenase (oxaloacetate-decarboxylating)(NADP+)
MAIVAVVDAQLKCKGNIEEAVQTSSWWKRLKKRKK